MSDPSPAPDQLRHLLSEREKELDGLYRIAGLFSRPFVDVGAFLGTTADILRASMEHPEHTRVRIETDGYRMERGTAATIDDSCSARQTYSIVKNVCIEVSCAGTTIHERERRLISSTAALMGDVLQREEMDLLLRESTRTLQRQTAELERKNIALREVLSQIEHEKRALQRDARARVDAYLRPYLRELAAGEAADARTRTCIDQIESVLSGLFGSDDRRLVEISGRLSPREAEICELVRNGLTTKEIAAFLNISRTTVERHRNTVRRKLKLNGTGANLTAYLRSGRSPMDTAPDFGQ